MKEFSQEKKDLFKNASWLFCGGTARAVLAGLETIILARFLGLEMFGVFSIIVAYVKLLNNFFDFRVWETTVKYVGEYWENREAEKTKSIIKFSYTIDLVTGLVAFCISVALAKVANEYFIGSEHGFIYIVIYSVSLLVSTANTTSDSILRVFSRFRSIAFTNSFEIFIRVIMVAIVLLAGYSIKGVLVAYVLANIAGFITRQVIVNEILRTNELEGWIYSGFGIIRERLREISWFLLNTSFMGTLKMANESYLALLALGYFTGKDAAGLYKVARSIVKAMARFVDPVYETIYPKLVSLKEQRSLDRFTEIMKYSLSTMMKFAVPVALLVVIFAEFIIDLFFGAQYLPASNTMRVLTIAIVINHLTFWINPALLAVGKPGKRSVLEIMTALIYIASLLILVQQMSLLGAAFAFLIACVFKSSMALYFFRTEVRTSF